MRYFAYCRKSSEGEERQALSIPAQIDEIKHVFGDAQDVQIAEWFEEKMSAKAPGRPIYAAMIKRIERGEADGIVAWHPDRLARNSVDGGWVIHLLDRRVLKDLKFVSYSYEHSPQGMFMLQIMFGQSKYYVDNLSVNVKRGLRKKIEMGWLPNLAPLGYRNDRETSTVAVDPERFPLLRRAWELLLGGAHSVSQINTIANTEWGFRTPKRKKSGGRPLSLAATYRMFGNPFYAGVLNWYDAWRPGKHEPMVTLAEFNRAQAILGRPSPTRPKTHTFAYTGLIRCACGLAVTAEEKVKPSGRRYIYYRCTRRAQPRCNEPAVRSEVIDQHIWAHLQSIHIPDDIAQSIAKEFGDGDAEAKAVREKQAASAERALHQARQELKTLTDLRVRELLTDEEFVERRKALQMREIELQQSIRDRGIDATDMFELASSVTLFKKYAADWFLEGADEDKRLILRSICSNSVLAGGTLSIQTKLPFEHVEKSLDCFYLRGVVEDVRTLAYHESEAKALVAVVDCLKERAEARRTGTLVPSPSPSLSSQRTAPRGRASWRASRELHPASDRGPVYHDRAA